MPTVPTLAAGRPGSLDDAPRERRYIPTLDGWRAVAIVVVMLQHSSDEITRLAGSWIEPLTNLFRENGRLGVSVFFAISGFLITSLLIEEIQTRSLSLRAFYIRRAFRILPPLLVVLAVFGALGLAGVIPIPAGKWFGSLAFMYNYTPGESSWYLGHFWSLSVEEHFYLLWPIGLAVLGMARARRACVGIIVAVGVWRFVDLSLGLTADWSIHYNDRTDTQVDGLLWGCLLALLFVNPAARATLARITTGWRYWGYLVALVVTQALDAPNAFVHSLQLSIRPLLIVILVIGTVARPTRQVGRVLEAKPLRWLGRISYSLYLWQQLFLVWDDFHADKLGRLQTFPISVLAAVTMAVLSHRLIERPAIRLGRRLAGKVRAGHRPHVATTAAA